MIESPVLQRFAANQERKGMVRALIKILEVRFGSIPDDFATLLGAINDQVALDRLLASATRCSDLNAFRSEMSA